VKSKRHSSRSGFAWLELLLGIAAIFLLFQLFPSMLSKLFWVVDVLIAKLLWAVDPRNWSQLTFFLVNVAVVILLTSVRFGPNGIKNGIADWKERQKRIAKERTKAEKVEELKKQREAIDRMETSRSRRMY